MAVWVKICGITTLHDAEIAVSAGADAIGLNVVPSSKRRIEPTTARPIAEAVRGKIEIVLVVANSSREQIENLKQELNPDWVQFHGDEEPAALEPFLPRAYKAVRIEDAGDVAQADAYPGERLLVDAKVSGELGGTGRAFDHSLVRGLAKRRSLIVAGGLDPENVARVVQSVTPFGVDTASGVEVSGSPRHKDPERVLAFVQRAKGLVEPD